MSVSIGEVIAVEGISITIKMFEDSNKDVLFFAGEKYKGISIREHLLIQRGFIDIVCIVEGEFLDENKTEYEGNRLIYTRKIKVRPIGYYKDNSFNEGVKFLPMIKDLASLISEDKIAAIYNKNSKNSLSIGKMLKEELPVYLPWKKLFNTHIGIFGNTGSGKSNTLTKLYTSLFSEKLLSIKNKSHFILLDFNGEYTSEQLLQTTDKEVIHLNTKDAKDRFPLREDEFWESETLSLLFQATINTQRPFLRRIIDGRNKYAANADSLAVYTKAIFRDVFSSAAQKPDCLELLRTISRIIKNDLLSEKLKNISWYSQGSKFTLLAGSTVVYFNAGGTEYDANLKADVDQLSVNVDHFDELLLRANIRLCNDLLHGYVQFDHIQPLLKRIESNLTGLKKVLCVVTEDQVRKVLTVISLRKCSSEVKKILPLLVAKHYYNQHKNNVQNPPDKTLHLIIDEAHNILSEQSTRESESWKDYRLELFEEIIKEGRKFGMFLTISSQRPADISPTIVSQIHNFFIHRLVNDRDLHLIDNTISTLDRLSRELIPTLPKGACVVTGTSFPLPMVVVVDLLDRSKQPDSEDVDLETLWN
ncbi:MAG: nucleotidyltransferase [Bdellovibrionales bacterium RIFCSPHIGHO2_01_FULL_40_29]|nr:MAG: nucleotidyltransferase [Bdellovibrionales bacterium RIFCSPHIGHO2_01_FULL_40_29]OFZ35227.1 MAG: nucleotidyltransferase [Bdellovibrionales bacterium RIFCSPHIGHO2_02_FULL_40_15]